MQFWLHTDKHTEEGTTSNPGVSGVISIRLYECRCYSVRYGLCWACRPATFVIQMDSDCSQISVFRPKRPNTSQSDRSQIAGVMCSDQPDDHTNPLLPSIPEQCLPSLYTEPARRRPEPARTQLVTSCATFLRRPPVSLRSFSSLSLSIGAGWSHSSIA